MLNSSHFQLKLLAAIVWFCGFIALFLKSYSLLMDAHVLNPNQVWLLLAFLFGVIIGGLKAKYLFNPICIKNLKRIYALEQPKIWNCYRPQFFIFLFSMVTLGAYLSHIAQGSYWFLLVVAIIDASIASALLGSSFCFWSFKRVLNN